MELEVLDLLHYSPVDLNGGVFCPPFPVVHNQILCLDHIEGKVVVVSDLLLIGCLIVVGDQAIISSSSCLF